jgi:predicted DNA-binding transcriptional regulator AlpA
MRLLDHDGVNAKTGPRSKPQRWRDVKADKFPRPVKDGDQNRWPETEIESYAAWRIAVRDGTTKAETWSAWRAEQERRQVEARITARDSQAA